jgi:hypothetical protein
VCKYQIAVEYQEEEISRKCYTNIRESLAGFCLETELLFDEPTEEDVSY